MNNTKSITPPLGEQRGGRTVSLWGQVKKALASAPVIWEEVREEAHTMVKEECRAFLLAIFVYVRFNFDIADIVEMFPLLPAKVRYYEKEIDDLTLRPLRRRGDLTSFE